MEASQGGMTVTAKESHTVSIKSTFSGIGMVGVPTNAKMGYVESHEWTSVPTLFVQELNKRLEKHQQFLEKLVKEKHEDHDKVKIDIVYTVDGKPLTFSNTICFHRVLKLTKEWNKVCSDISKFLDDLLDERKKQPRNLGGLADDTDE